MVSFNVLILLMIIIIMSKGIFALQSTDRHKIFHIATATLLRLLQLLNSVETHPAPANKSARPLVDMDLKEEALAVRGITLRTAAEANIMVQLFMKIRDQLLSE